MITFPSGQVTVVDQVDALQTQIDECCAATASCSGDLDENGEVAVADLFVTNCRMGHMPIVPSTALSMLQPQSS